MLVTFAAALTVDRQKMVGKASPTARRASLMRLGANEVGGHHD